MGYNGGGGHCDYSILAEWYLKGKDARDMYFKSPIELLRLIGIASRVIVPQTKNYPATYR